MARVPYNKLLTNLTSSSRTGEYWLVVVAVRTERSEIRTKKTDLKIHSLWPSLRKWSVWQNPDQERTNQNARICMPCYVISVYYSFKIFPRFWLVKTRRLIHHNQLLLTKFAKHFVIFIRWRQNCSPLWIFEPMTEKTWGRDCVKE